MTLKDNLSDKDADDLDSTQSRGGKSVSGSSSSDLYKKEERVPFCVMFRDEQSGHLRTRLQPQDMTLTAIKESKKHSWTLERPPENWVRHYMSRSSVELLHHRAEKHLNADLIGILKDDPEKGLEIINQVARITTESGRGDQTMSCAVCDNQIGWGGDYEMINRNPVCADHTIAEVKGAGLMTENRIWD